MVQSANTVTDAQATLTSLCKFWLSVSMFVFCTCACLCLATATHPASQCATITNMTRFHSWAKAGWADYAGLTTRLLRGRAGHEGFQATDALYRAMHTLTKHSGTVLSRLAWLLGVWAASFCASVMSLAHFQTRIFSLFCRF